MSIDVLVSMSIDMLVFMSIQEIIDFTLTVMWQISSRMPVKAKIFQ